MMYVYKRPDEIHQAQPSWENVRPAGQAMVPKHVQFATTFTPQNVPCDPNDPASRRVLTQLGLTPEQWCKLRPEDRAYYLVEDYRRNYYASWAYSDQEVLQLVVRNRATIDPFPPNPLYIPCDPNSPVQFRILTEAGFTPEQWCKLSPEYRALFDDGLRPYPPWGTNPSGMQVRSAGQVVMPPSNATSITLSALVLAGLIGFYFLTKPEELTPAQQRSREEAARRRDYEDYQRDLAAARARARR